MSYTIYQPFLEWVSKDPTRPAVIDLEKTWSYEEVYEKAVQIALALASYNNSKATRVAILGNKSNSSIGAILGALFAGFAYCPLDINLPAARLDKIFSILSPMGLILTGLTPPLKYALGRLREKPSFILDLGGDLPSHILTGIERINPLQGSYAIRQVPENPAYIIFTSGSTGVPKGVSISHLAADSALDMFQEHVRINEADRICNQVALCFDLSVFDIFGSLRQGASICLAPVALTAVPNRFIQYLVDKSITSLFTVPSTVNYLIENTTKCLKDSALKNLLLSGEPLTASLLDKIESFFPLSLNLWNLYGATEIPYALAEKITKKKSPSFFSLKGKGVEIRINDLGELMVKSSAMLSGYHLEGSPTLYNPLKENWYPTGDRASIDAHGHVTLHGRKDRQIKIQGHRVELDEIEYELESYQEIQEAAVLFLEKESQLIAFIVLNLDFSEKKEALDLEERCRASLPLIMCPRYYHFLSDMPRTPSGKKDRKALIEALKLPQTEILQGVAHEAGNKKRA